MSEEQAWRGGVVGWDRYKNQMAGTLAVREQAQPGRWTCVGDKRKKPLEESGILQGREAESAGQSKWARGLGPKTQGEERTLTGRKPLPSPGCRTQAKS